MEDKVPKVIRVVTLNSVCWSLYSHRFSTLMLMPQRWFSTGYRSRSWHASYESDPRRGRTASLCDSSSTAVRLRVRKICHLPCLRRVSQTFFPSLPLGALGSCENTAVVLPNFSTRDILASYIRSEGGTQHK